VNGRAASTDAPPATPLLWVIREGLKLTGTKFGCGTGLCGACMVHIGRQARVFVPDPGLGDRRQVRDHDRRTVARRGTDLVSSAISRHLRCRPFAASSAKASLVPDFA
jgi:hypothetical protein